MRIFTDKVKMIIFSGLTILQAINIIYLSANGHFTMATVITLFILAGVTAFYWRRHNRNQMKVIFPEEIEDELDFEEFELEDFEEEDGV